MDQLRDEVLQHRPVGVVLDAFDDLDALSGDAQAECVQRGVFVGAEFDLHLAQHLVQLVLVEILFE